MHFTTDTGEENGDVGSDDELPDTLLPDDSQHALQSNAYKGMQPDDSQHALQSNAFKGMQLSCLQWFLIQIVLIIFLLCMYMHGRNLIQLYFYNNLILENM